MPSTVAFPETLLPGECLGGRLCSSVCARLRTRARADAFQVQPFAVRLLVPGCSFTVACQTRGCRHAAKPVIAGIRHRFPCFVQVLRTPSTVDTLTSAHADSAFTPGVVFRGERSRILQKAMFFGGEKEIMLGVLFRVAARAIAACSHGQVRPPARSSLFGRSGLRPALFLKGSDLMSGSHRVVHSRALWLHRSEG